MMLYIDYQLRSLNRDAESHSRGWAQRSLTSWFERFIMAMLVIVAMIIIMAK